MFAKLLTTTGLLASTALADGAAIVDAINSIASATVSLNNTVAAWDGNLLGALPVIARSTELLVDIKKGTKTASASEAVSSIDAFTIAVATQSLVADVNTTLTNIVAAKPKFDALLIGSPITLLNLDLERKASGKFGEAVTEKIPADLQGAAEILTGQIDDAFDAAIHVYDPLFR